MKIIITADLHYGITGHSTICDMVHHLSAESPDVVVLAGDQATDADRFGQLLQIFRSSLPDTPILVLSGNHDLWCGEHDDYNSKDLWEILLPAITKVDGSFWLEGKNWTRDGVAIVGSYLHYDYSAQDTVGPASSLPHEYLAKNKYKVNKDGVYLRGLPDDITFAREIGEGFRHRLLMAQNDPEIESIVVVSHVPCVEQQITRRPSDYAWAIGTPYFGNISHQEIIFGCNKVRWIVSGHSHQEVSADLGRVQIFNLGSDYRNPAYKVIEIQTS